MRASRRIALGASILALSGGLALSAFAPLAQAQGGNVNGAPPPPPPGVPAPGAVGTVTHGADVRQRMTPPRRPTGAPVPSALGAGLPPSPAVVSGSEVHVPQPGHEHEAGEHEGPAAVNWTDFDNKEQPPYLAMLVNFAILAIIYVAFGKKPIAAALKARREQVSHQIEEAQKIKHEAEARSKQYASKLENLTEELESTKAGLAAAGAGERVRIVKEAEEKAVRMEKDAEFLLAQERRQAEIELRREAVVAALADAEQLLKTKLTQADQERVAEEFLATLVPAKTSSLGGAS